MDYLRPVAAKPILNKAKTCTESTRIVDPAETEFHNELTIQWDRWGVRWVFKQCIVCVNDFWY